jgi:uroporphyrinogen-III synthase
LPEDTPRGILITRPEPGASATARRVASLGWEPLLAPMLELSPRPARLPAPGSVQAILVTSASALPGLTAPYFEVPLLAVGDATAAAATRAGFRVVASAGADAAALAKLVAATRDRAGKPLLLATAAGQGMGLAADLREAGFRVARRTVYETRPVERIPAAAAAALAHGRVAGVLFFSPATAHAFVRAVCKGGLHDGLAGTDAVVISAAARDAVAPLPWRRIRVASRPNQDELLALLT